MIGTDSLATLETIVVKPSGGRLSLSEVSTIIHDEGGDLLATAPAENPAGCLAYRLRLRIGSLEDLVAALTARGHRVLAAAPEGSGASERAAAIEKNVSCR
jgi:hypothetical protein